VWCHGLRSPVKSYANDPYNETYFGAPEGELLQEGMKQHFIRGHQLRERYVDQLKLVGEKYSRYETVVRSSDTPRCSQSALVNLAGFYAGSPTFPSRVPNWPSKLTPIPIHTVPHDEDYVALITQDNVCKQFDKAQVARMQRQEFQDFLASNWRLFHTINSNSGGINSPFVLDYLQNVSRYQTRERLQSDTT
ncbi:hypothetical protein PENTCL1PPCAC_3038, partial [Pristionchus entomophagus]